jgi:hypothetical protein
VNPKPQRPGKFAAADSPLLGAFSRIVNPKHSVFSLFMFAAFMDAAEPRPTDKNEKKPAKLSVQAGNLKQTYACGAGVEPLSIENGVLYANLRRGDDRYLLIAYSELSRPSNPNGRCGAGLESYLVWLHIRGSTVTASQSAQYESCWKDISGGPPAWSGQFCSVEYEDFDSSDRGSTNTRSKASFDAKAPEKGIQVISQPPETLK